MIDRGARQAGDIDRYTISKHGIYDPCLERQRQGRIDRSRCARVGFWKPRVRVLNERPLPVSKPSVLASISERPADDPHLGGRAKTAGRVAQPKPQTPD